MYIIKTIKSFCLLSTLLAVMAVSTTATAMDFVLVTPDEYQEAVDKGENPYNDLVAKSVANGPQINVVSPTVSQGKLVSPVDIKVEFKAADAANIDMSSLKIFYLMFIKKDVTSRILESADMGKNSISAKGAKLPSGTHKFLVEISDSENRKASQKFVVEVGS